MTGRGLGTAFRGSPAFTSGHADLAPRIDGLAAAVDAARTRLHTDVLDAADVAVSRARGRLQVSTRHTIVAIAGATGSGKSTMFNALSGRELSRSGPERPTTSATTALVCGDDDVTDLLDWLAVPAERRHRQLPTAPDQPGVRLPEGLVLLDLPDHDSTEVAHHEEAERVVALADLLIWVVDPQKYADAALHHRLLQPHARHREVMIVVLNHIDTVPEEQRGPMLRDVRRVVAADGIRDPLVLTTSARTGAGMDDLRALIRRRVEEKRDVTLRVRADLGTSAARLQAAAGQAPPTVPELWVGDLTRRLAEAAGVPGYVERRRAAAQAAVLGQLRRPFGGRGASTRNAELRSPGPTDRSAVESAARDLADNVTRELTDAWGAPVRSVATARLGTTCDRLDAELSEPPDARTPDWVSVVNPVRALLALLTVAGALLMAFSPAAGAALLALGAGGLAALWFGAGPLAARAAQESADGLDRALRDTVSRVAVDHVVRPVNEELASFRQFHRSLDAVRS